METTLKKALRVIALTLLPLVLWSTNGYCVSPQEIYDWVSRQMKMEQAGKVPDVTYVNKKDLQALFQEYNSKSYTQMQSSLGKDYAQEIMDQYLENIVGLFHPETRAIYVGDFLEPCQRQAVTAHELAHYLQDKKSGRIHPDDYRAGDKRTLREMEAGHIEKEYEKQFCQDGQLPEQTLSSLD